jgi:hypothetical protein
MREPPAQIGNRQTKWITRRRVITAAVKFLPTDPWLRPSYNEFSMFRQTR